MNGPTFLLWWFGFLVLNLPVLFLIMRVFSFRSFSDLLESFLFHFRVYETTHKSRTPELLGILLIFGLALALEIFLTHKFFPNYL
ncbi:MAG: hypothetical protein KC964_19160 [Candidatus Omnitrophica bacterium]|nr:hypothetical protein [Candidatus Omnitrophota bacterium]